MKGIMKSLLVFGMVFLFAFGFVGCKPEEAQANLTFSYSLKTSQEGTLPLRLEISVEEAQSGCTLLQLMQDAKDGGKLDFEESGGMITSINGVANPADFSCCWMLYTSDAEMANNAWGTITVEGETLGLAIVGANALVVLEGEIYVWEYVTFE